MSKKIPRKLLMEWLAEDAKDSMIKMLSDPLVVRELAKHIRAIRKPA